MRPWLVRVGAGWCSIDIDAAGWACRCAQAQGQPIELDGRRAMPDGSGSACGFSSRYVGDLGMDEKSDFGLKLYISVDKSIQGGHNLPCVWWEVRRFFDRLRLNTGLARWLQHCQLPRAAPLLASIGAEPQQLRPSRKSRDARAQTGAEADASGPCLLEWVASTHYMLASLLDWHASLRAPKTRQIAGELLELLLDNFLRDRRASVLERHRKPPSDGADPCPAANGQAMCNHVANLMAIMTQLGEYAANSLVVFLKAMFKNAEACPAVRCWLASFLAGASLEIDELLMDAPPPCVKDSPDVVKHPRGKKRCRRLDQDLVL